MQWNLEKLFKNSSEWENSLNEVNNKIEEVKKYKNTLKDKNKLKEFILLTEEISKELYRVYQYASLSNDLNLKDNKLLERKEKAIMAFQKFGLNVSFYSPELLTIDLNTLLQYCDEDEKINEYRFDFESLFRSRKHVLSEDKEEMMANFSSVSSANSRLYSSLSTSDRVYDEVELSDKKVVVTQSNWTSLIKESKTEEDRQKIFNAIYSDFDKHKNTYAAIYNTILQNNNAKKKIRNYDSILDSYLFGNNIPKEVYESLIFSAKETAPSLYKYLELKKKYLKLEKYKTYHRFLSLAESKRKYEYNEALDLFFESIKNMPKEFIEFSKLAVSEGQVDVLEKEGKRTGAYSSGGYTDNPYILLNYDKTLNDVFTVAHEAGHSTHTLFSKKYQPYATSNYTIFVAEIASTFNEHQLLDTMLEKAKTKDEKIVLLEMALNNIYSTFYRQALFAYYEYEANKLVENNTPITSDVLSDIMIKLYKDFYNIDLKDEPLKKYVWAYIPHLFRTPFYVYQYATSFSASLKLYENIKLKKPNALENYLNLLKSGGNDYPVNQVKKAGCDLTDKNTFLAVKNRLEELLVKLEKTLEE